MLEKGIPVGRHRMDGVAPRDVDPEAVFEIATLGARLGGLADGRCGGGRPAAGVFFLVHRINSYNGRF